MVICCSEGVIKNRDKRWGDKNHIVMWEKVSRTWEVGGMEKTYDS